MNSTFKNFLWYALPFLIRNFIPLISLPFFTRYISPSDFGTLALSVIYGVFIVGLLNLGLISVFERNYFELKERGERIELMWTCIIFVLTNLTIGVMLTFYFEVSINHILFGEIFPTYLTVLAISHLSIKSILQYFYIYLRNAKKANLYALISIAEALICVALSIYFVYYQKGVLGYVLGQAIGVFSIFVLLFLWSLMNNQVHFKIKLLRQNLALSLPLTPRVFFGTINTQFDRFMLGKLNSSLGVGLYDIGQKIANLGFLFMTVLQQVFSPEVFSTYINKPKQFATHVGNFLVPFFYVSLLFCLLLGVFSQEIVILLTTPAYYDSYPIIVILNMLYATYFFGKQPQLILAKKMKLISYLSFLTIFINMLFNIPLIYFFGIIGAAWGTFFSGMFVASISFYFGQKYAFIAYNKFSYQSYLLFQLFMFFVLILWYLNPSYELSLLIRIALVFIFIVMGFSQKLMRDQFSEIFSKMRI
jgi:O-antigen/teichoic acid export membrane protein